MSVSTSHDSLAVALDEALSYTSAADTTTPLVVKVFLYLAVIGLLCFLVVAGFTDIALILAQEAGLRLLNARRTAIDYVVSVPFNETASND
jgi:hypothetical protein